MSDFKVKYRFKSADEGGRSTPAYQGYRPDFWYFHSDHIADHVFMIWPIFENEIGKVMDDKRPIPAEGIAQMIIVKEDYIDYHRNRIEVGTHGYFIEGPRKVADCEVIEIGKRLRS